MRRLLTLAAAAALLAAGCGGARSGSLGPAPTLAPTEQAGSSPPAATPGATPDTSSAAATSARPTRTGAGPRQPDTITVQVWFARAGRLTPTKRTRPVTPATSRLAMTELAAGPSAAEKRAGLTTGLPADPGFTVRAITDGVTTIDLPPAFYAGEAATVRLRQAQVVYTLTQFPTASSVRFLFAGEPAGPPAGREDYADLLAPIVVREPVTGQRVSSPLTIVGTADVYEATVNVRVLNGAGRQLATTFTTATCSSGCRGTYRVTLTYRSAAAGPGTVEVYQVSPQDGSRRDVVAVPVRLAESR